MNTQGELRRYDTAYFRIQGAKGLDGKLLAQALEREFGGVTVQRMQGESVELDVVRDDEQPGTVDFMFIDEGELSYFVEDGWKHLSARLVVIPQGVTRKIRLLGRWQVTLVQVPRDAMEGFVSELPSEVVLVDHTSLLGHSMQAFAKALMQLDSNATSIESYAVEQLLLEMGGALLLDRLGGVGWSRENPQAVLRDRALAVIAQQCIDVDLTPARVAWEVQSSLRHLQLVFANVGSTVAGEIRRRRTQVARVLLIDSRYDALTIEQVAERSGFGTATSMRRALQDAFGAGPRELRARDQSNSANPVI